MSRIEDDFLQARNLTKVLRLVGDGQHGDEWVAAALYGIANAMDDSINNIAAEVKTAKLAKDPPSKKKKKKSKS